MSKRESEVSRRAALVEAAQSQLREERQTAAMDAQRADRDREDLQVCVQQWGVSGVAG